MRSKISYKLVLLVILFLGSSMFGGWYSKSLTNQLAGREESWPELKVDKVYKDISLVEVEAYKEIGFDVNRISNSYDSFDKYLNYAKYKKFRESDRVRFDEEGIPLVKYGADFHYNPVTVSQFALTQYSRYMEGDVENLKVFFIAVDKLIDMQGSDGALRYNFRWKYYLSGEVYEPGWVSGMAQGLVLSVYARAYDISQDHRYLKAGSNVFSFLIKRKENGGTMTTLVDLDDSLDDYVFFAEYLSTPNNYTLNGFMFTLLGIHDWNQVNEKYGVRGKAGQYFRMGMATLTKILPYYDIGGFSAYDLGHLTYGKKPHVAARYHFVHLNLLDALYSASGSRNLNVWSSMWKYHVM